MPFVPYEIVREENVEAQMRDGTILRANIARPRARGKFPALVQRTPYGKGWACAGLAAYGYVVINQDLRGRYASEGEFIPLFTDQHHDAEDGYDTIEWAASLPYCDGNVGTFGGSYCSWTQWQLAPRQPPHLRAMAAGVLAARLTDMERGGIFRTGRALEWVCGSLAPDTRRRTGGPKPHTPEEFWRLWDTALRGKFYWFLPLAELPEWALGTLGEYYRQWLADHTTDHFHFCERHKDVAVPNLHYTGWYDRHIGTVDHFNGVRQNALSDLARRSQRLIIGPWTHGLLGGQRVGEMDFGPQAALNYEAVVLRWFDYWLKGIENGVLEGPPVRIFVMGANHWRDEEEWPPARAEEVVFYLHSRGRANTPYGDGSLSPDPPKDEEPDRFTYDPRDPVPTLYGQRTQDEPRDQRVLDHREDVLVYQTPPLPEEVEVTGYPVLKLYAASSAPDTDFTAKLVDVHPNGFAQNLCYGILRARYRQGFARPELLTPGEVVEYTLELQPTSNRFLKGHRIRLDISSSDFPNFDRNHNTGGADYFEATLRVAEQTVLHDRVHPSRLILPVIREA